MWLHHLRHLTLTNLQRQQRRTIGTTCDLGLAQVHLGSVGQSGRTPDSQWDAMMGKGQVALTMHHIGLGQSNVGVKRRPSAGGPAGVQGGIPARVAGSRRRRRRRRWQHRRRWRSREASVVSLLHVLV